MTVSYGIISTQQPERIKMRDHVVEKLARPVMITKDDDGKGPAWNMVQCIRMMQNFMPANYYTVFQDDLELSSHLADALEHSAYSFFTRHPKAVLGLFNNTVKANEARNRGNLHFKLPLTGKNWLWTYGVVFPADTANVFCAYYDQCWKLGEWPITFSKHTLPQYKGRAYIVDDSFLAYFIRTYGYEAWCVTDSLIQHIGGTQSQLGHTFDPSTGKNYSPNFIGANSDAREYV